ncbi:MAG: hypothetical protein M3256_06085 [Actinomycetota bacterium]|nr:hypothetical protein [Actinomycetota bacterium]
MVVRLVDGPAGQADMVDATGNETGALGHHDAVVPVTDHHDRVGVGGRPGRGSGYRCLGLPDGVGEEVVSGPRFLGDVAVLLQPVVAGGCVPGPDNQGAGLARAVAEQGDAQGAHTVEPSPRW